MVIRMALVLWTLIDMYMLDTRKVYPHEWTKF